MKGGVGEWFRKCQALTQDCKMVQCGGEGATGDPQQLKVCEGWEELIANLIRQMKGFSESLCRRPSTRQIEAVISVYRDYKCERELLLYACGSCAVRQTWLSWEIHVDEMQASMVKADPER